MTLNDVKFKPWRNGTNDNSTGYGLCVSKKYTHLFQRKWKTVVVIISCSGKSEEIEFNLNKTFWTTCPDLKNIKVKKWLEISGNINWEGRKPELKTAYLGDNKFKVFL